MSSQPEHSNVNGGTSDENHMSSQLEHSITVEEYRISGPVYLPIPVRYNGLVGQRYRDAWDAGLESDIRQILRHHNILRAAINLDKRRTEHIQAAPQSADYIFIEVTEPSEGGEWLHAVNEILDSCRQRGSGPRAWARLGFRKKPAWPRKSPWAAVARTGVLAHSPISAFLDFSISDNSH